jgi:hypothetical protein
VRGAVLDLIMHPYPKKLMILIPAYIGTNQVAECEFLLERFIDRADFRVVLLDGKGGDPHLDTDVPRVGHAIAELGWQKSCSDLLG